MGGDAFIPFLGGFVSGWSWRPAPSPEVELLAPLLKLGRDNKLLLARA
jgi:hypothetical protein